MSEWFTVAYLGLTREQKEEVSLMGEAHVLGHCNPFYERDDLKDKVRALEQRIAELEKATAEREPVAWLWIEHGVPVNAFRHIPDAEDPYWKEKGFTTAPLYL